MSSLRLQRSRAFLPAKSFIAVVAALAAVLAIAGLTYRSLDERTETADHLQQATTTRNLIDQLQLQIERAHSGQRGFVISGDEMYLNHLELLDRSLAARIAELREALDDNREQLARLTDLEALAKVRIDLIEQTVEMKRRGEDARAIAIVKSGRGRSQMDELRRVFSDMLAANELRVAQRTQAWQQSVRWSSYVMLGGAGVLVTLLFVIALLASRDFRVVENESWVRRLQLDLGSRVQGDLRVESIGDKVLGGLVDNLDAQVAAMYVREGDGLRRIAGHALRPDARTTLGLGDGLAGQAALENRLLFLDDVPERYLEISSATGRSSPRQVAIVPAVADGQTQAVIELGFLRRVDKVEVDVLGRLAPTIAAAVRSARDRSRLEELLEETQRQAEELQSQQEELRATNEELEQQARALQASQTQLEHQQSELEQVNAQLEEHSTSMQRQRDEIARASADLQRANEYKSQFLANMSHELRTPLNSSLILAKLLADNREGNLNTEQVQFARTIYSAGNDLLTLINDILDLSKIEAGMLDVRPEPVHVRRCLEDLTNTFRPLAAQKQLALDTTIADGTPETIETDVTRLLQILKNLLSNACKFTERGGVSLHIEQRGDAIAFAVRDTGIGIPADQQEVIFEAFRQADGATTRKFGGTGLGLSISRDLARLLGGDLHVDSAPGSGSTFTLTLPLRAPARAPAPARRAVAPAPAAKAPSPAPPAPPSRLAPFEDDRARLGPDARSLLVIEDDVSFARVLFDLAHELDYVGVIAANGEDGIALARELVPTAIVLDVGLPDRSGLAVLDALKRDSRTRHIPVHVVSAHDYTRTALEMGAAGYALKPIEREKLATELRKLEERYTHRVRRVLIVEDDPLLRDSTARLLATDDVDTVTAGNTAEALKLLETTTFDCMVLDLALPDRSGLELLEEMSRSESYSFPPVIVYTGRSLSTAEVHALERFSQSIIIKGARSPERLLDEVTLFLHQVESELPPERQRMLRDARDREAVFEGKRILIVEDDVRNVFALTAVLEPKGAKLAIARNGREAVAALDADPQIDLVLMDIMMPEMDGIEATRELRKDPRFAKLPIIALTAKAMVDDREKCLAAGANDYIAKPLDVDKLLSLARVWIRK